MRFAKFVGCCYHACSDCGKFKDQIFDLDSLQRSKDDPELYVLPGTRNPEISFEPNLFVDVDFEVGDTVELLPQEQYWGFAKTVQGKDNEVDKKLAIGDKIVIKSVSPSRNSPIDQSKTLLLLENASQVGELFAGRFKLVAKKKNEPTPVKQQEELKKFMWVLGESENCTYEEALNRAKKYSVKFPGCTAFVVEIKNRVKTTVKTTVKTETVVE